MEGIYIYIYVYYFVGNNGVLLRIKFMFKKKIYERIEVLNKKEVKFFFDIIIMSVGVGLIVLRQFSGNNAIWCYASSIFESADFSSGFGTRAIPILQIPAPALGLLIIDKFGRRPILMVSAAGMCFSCFLAGLSFLLQDLKQWKETTPILVLIILLIYFATFSLGVSGVPWLVVSEMYPINIKGSAGGLVSLANWFFSVVVTYTFNYMFEWSSPGTFFFYSLISAATVLFTAKLIPETKGRTLEEIQASMTKFLE
uniref:Major facilitator superfamily (MFS) profile domain-containing protein n=1 Tax=Vitis vinifera TaxID=29760 RepID=F6HU04_VITVI